MGGVGKALSDERDACVLESFQGAGQPFSGGTNICRRFFCPAEWSLKKRAAAEVVHLKIRWVQVEFTFRRFLSPFSKIERAVLSWIRY